MFPTIMSGSRKGYGMKDLICLNGDCLLRLDNGTCVEEDRPKVCNQRKTITDIFEDIKREIKRMKVEVCSTNSDYNTGYISALSTLEGLLTEMEN